LCGSVRGRGCLTSQKKARLICFKRIHALLLRLIVSSLLGAPWTSKKVRCSPISTN
jgi:hypothetical protein